ncbi:hypothetical protein ACWD4O_23165 [Streptomyces sp. NPDC002623]
MGAHALRLIYSGLFDDFPGASLMLGHMGELLPFQTARLDSRSEQVLAEHRTRHLPSYYLRHNVYVVLRVQQELGQLIDVAAGAGDVAGDSRGDPVTVLGRSLAVRAKDHGPPVGGESAVAAGGIAAGEVAKQDQIGRSRGQVGEAQRAVEVGELLLGEWLVGGE